MTIIIENQRLPYLCHLETYIKGWNYVARAIIVDVEINVTEQRVLYSDKPEQGFD